MKHTLIILAAALSIAACNPKDKKTGNNGNTTDTAGKLTPDQIAKAGADSANFTTIQWIDSTVQSLGKLKHNQSVEITYRFRNSGDKVLIIENVSTSCGCTIAEKPEKPIDPGAEGVIKATFNGSGNGRVSRDVRVFANTKPQKEHVLSFNGDVQE